MSFLYLLSTSYPNNIRSTELVSPFLHYKTDYLREIFHGYLYFFELIEVRTDVEIICTCAEIPNGVIFCFLLCWKIYNTYFNKKTFCLFIR